MTRKRTLPQRVIEYCRTRQLVRPQERVLVAVSGGADSVALLILLRDLRPVLSLDLVVGHVDHGARPSAADDADFVQCLVETLGVPFTLRRVHCETRGRSFEEEARNRRYEALHEMAREVGATRIATGHTATDQAETVILRLIRGTGPLGLAAILPATREGIVRPLLCATREEVRDFLRSRGQAWREDPTNADRRFLRNRVRAEVLPLLRDLNPRIDFTLTALAEDLEGWASLGEAASPGTREAPGEVLIPRDPAWPHPLRAYRLREAWARLTGGVRGLSRAHLEALVRLWDGSGGAETHLPCRVIARREGPVLRLWQEPPDRPPQGSRRRARPTGPRPDAREANRPGR